MKPTYGSFYKEDKTMADNKNMELNDEVMTNAAGGDADRSHTRDGIIVGAYDNPWYPNKWWVQTEPNQNIVAYCDVVGVNMIGRKVRCKLVGMGAWEIIGLLD